MSIPKSPNSNANALARLIGVYETNLPRVVTGGIGGAKTTSNQAWTRRGRNEDEKQGKRSLQARRTEAAVSWHYRGRRGAVKGGAGAVFLCT